VTHQQLPQDKKIELKMNFHTGFMRSLTLLAVLALNHQVSGLRQVDSLRSGTAVGLASSLGALEGRATHRTVNHYGRSRSRRELTRSINSLERMVNRMCGVVEQLDATQWWEAEMCSLNAIRPTAYPAFVSATRQCLKDAFGDFESYWEYQKNCNLNEKLQDPRNRQFARCALDWVVEHLFEFVLYTMEQSRQVGRTLPQVDQDAMRECLTNSVYFSGVSDDLIEDVISLLATNSAEAIKALSSLGSPNRAQL